MQSCTIQLGVDTDLYFARLYHLRLQLQQVGCTVDDYQLKENALSGLSALYIPMTNQLRTVQSLDLTMVNEMLSEVYVNDILPKKSKKNPIRGYRSKAAMTTTTTAKRSGKKRDINEIVCHNCKVRVTLPTSVRLRDLSLGTPPRSGAPYTYTRRGHI